MGGGTGDSPVTAETVTGLINSFWGSGERKNRKDTKPGAQQVPVEHAAVVDLNPVAINSKDYQAISRGKSVGCVWFDVSTGQPVRSLVLGRENPDGTEISDQILNNEIEPISHDLIIGNNGIELHFITVAEAEAQLRELGGLSVEAQVDITPQLL